MFPDYEASLSTYIDDFDSGNRTPASTARVTGRFPHLWFGPNSNTIGADAEVEYRMARTATDMQADYAVVGAGSAGCVLANRLSEDGSRVVVLEAGPRDWHPMIHVPAGVLKLLNNPLVNWNYTTDPEPGIAGRQMHWPRGRVLGGTSSINGMLWIRGNPVD